MSKKDESDEPIMGVVVEILMDEENETYKTKSYLEIAKAIVDKDEGIPRDIVLAMIYELGCMSGRLAEKAGVTEAELDEYVEQRETVEAVNETDNLNSDFRQKNDTSIDNAIDELFNEDKTDE